MNTNKDLKLVQDMFVYVHSVPDSLDNLSAQEAKLFNSVLNGFEQMDSNKINKDMVAPLAEIKEKMKQVKSTPKNRSFIARLWNAICDHFNGKNSIRKKIRGLDGYLKWTKNIKKFETLATFKENIKQFQEDIQPKLQSDYLSLSVIDYINHAQANEISEIFFDDKLKSENFINLYKIIYGLTECMFSLNHVIRHEGKRKDPEFSDTLGKLKEFLSEEVYNDILIKNPVKYNVASNKDAEKQIVSLSKSTLKICESYLRNYIDKMVDLVQVNEREKSIFKNIEKINTHYHKLNTQLFYSTIKNVINETKVQEK